MILNNYKLCLGKQLFNASGTTNVGNALIGATTGERLPAVKSMPFGSTYQGIMCVSQDVAMSNSDIVFGSSKQPVTADDYKIIDEIYEGIAISSQVSTISYANDRWTITITKTMVNRSGNVLNINEVGIKLGVGENSQPILATREILPSTLVVQPNETFTLQSQITMKI